MMMVSGITLYHERPPAVVVPPSVLHQVSTSPSVATGTQAVSGYAAAQWQQHPDQSDHSRQDSYNLHGKLVHHWESTGSRLDRLA
ncbi:hypothetical protein MMIC_P1493 [Mariprofundus micogutta]|uniref:Uncharacterized protein n=1 Tax=Mariprofundus micogutta TaxID=1921010 RepID=A0A1L8CNQ8_9PROT|nr:hypothetical protein [Mariprofundus micogutta]GAV20524.1 hypothetical protein MMIC_P1493 [Mariprofundus micogutta]